MDAHEIARQRTARPVRHPGSPETLEGLLLMEEGGECGEVTVELAATLAQRTPPSPRPSSENCVTCWRPRTCPPPLQTSLRLRAER